MAVGKIDWVVEAEELPPPPLKTHNTSESSLETHQPFMPILQINSSKKTEPTD